MISPHDCIEHLRDRARIAQGSVDPESVHELRVAAGRLSVWLELGGRHMLRDDLAWLRRSASRTRDLDVILERCGSLRSNDKVRHCNSIAELSASHAVRWPEWEALLRGERACSCDELVESLSSTRLTALLAALSWMPALDREVARDSLPRFRARVERAGARLEHTLEDSEGPEDIRALHRLRRAVRRLRYALEWLGEDARAVKALQDELGLLNDLAQLMRYLEPNSPSVETHDPGAGARSIEPSGPDEHPERRNFIVANERPRSGGAAANGATNGATNGHAPPREDIRREIARCRARFLHEWSRTRAAIDED
jgi:CHAD domain-containing protein